MANIAAAAAAAVDEDEAAAWADALDVDDSDLFLQPCTTAAPYPDKPPHSAHPQHRIPGPASAVQDAMRLRSASGSPVLGRERTGAQAPDDDFLLHPWLRALQFLGRDRAWEQPGIRVIRRDETLHRAPLVVGVVTSCKPNGLGDLFLTLKDPTNTIGASFHKKALSEESIGHDVSVGCVIILSKVVVFRPSRTACYLNVTKGNVVKVLRKDCDASKQVISSSSTESQLPAAKCEETRRIAHLGDNHMERRAGTETSEGTESIFSKMISRAKDSQVAEVLSENSSGTANVACSSVLGLDRSTMHSIGNKTDLNPPSMNVPSYKTSQRSLKTFKSINPANCQQRRGNSFMYERSEAEGSTNNIMMKLLGRERVMPSSKEMQIAEVFHDHHGTFDLRNSTSTLDTYAWCSSGNYQEIGPQTLAGGPHSKHTSNCSTDGHPKQHFNIPNMSCSQPSLGGSSGISGDRYCTQASANENLRWPLDNEQMFHSSKKLKSDAVLPDGNGATMNSRMDTENKHGLERNMNTELDGMAEQFNGEHASTREPNEHQERDFNAANAGSVQPTKEYATTVSGSFLPNPKKVVSVASVAGWTDEQLSELFSD